VDRLGDPRLHEEATSVLTCPTELRVCNSNRNAFGRAREQEGFEARGRLKRSVVTFEERLRFQKTADIRILLWPASPPIAWREKDSISQPQHGHVVKVRWFKARPVTFCWRAGTDLPKPKSAPRRYQIRWDADHQHGDGKYASAGNAQPPPVH
jgi:hypothetical protein